MFSDDFKGYSVLPIRKLAMFRNSFEVRFCGCGGVEDKIYQ